MTDFSTIDRLMEFGLGMGLAQQMIKTMNYSIGQMGVPGVGLNYNQVPTVSYYAIIDNAQAGPLSPTELQELVQRNRIDRSTLMWHPGLTGWRQACDIPEIYKLLVLAQ